MFPLRRSFDVILLQRPRHVLPHRARLETLLLAERSHFLRLRRLGSGVEENPRFTFVRVLRVHDAIPLAVNVHERFPFARTIHIGGDAVLLTAVERLRVELKLRRVAAGFTRDLRFPAEFDPRHSEDGPPEAVGERHHVLFVVVAEEEITSTHIVDAHGEAEELRLGPYVSVEADVFLRTLRVERRDGWVMRHLLGKERYVGFLRPRNRFSAVIVFTVGLTVVAVCCRHVVETLERLAEDGVVRLLSDIAFATGVERGEVPVGIWTLVCVEC